MGFLVQPGYYLILIELRNDEYNQINTFYKEIRYFGKIITSIMYQKHRGRYANGFQDGGCEKNVSCRIHIFFSYPFRILALCVF